MSQAHVDLAGLADSLDLMEFAKNLHVPAEQRARYVGLDGLLSLLQHRRESIEDDVAGDLFRAAAGFPVGVLPPDVLHDWFDLDWIVKMQGWEPARLELWLDGPHRRWLSNRRFFHAPATVIQSDLELLELQQDGLQEGEILERFLDHAARSFEPAELSRRERQRRRREGPLSWWELERCAVIDELPLVLDAPWPIDEGAAGMPFQDDAWRVAAGDRGVAAVDAFAAFAFAPVERSAEDPPVHDLSLSAGGTAPPPAWFPPGETREWVAPRDTAEWKERLMDAFGGERGTERSRAARRDRKLLPLAFQEGWLELFQYLARTRLGAAGEHAIELGLSAPFEFRTERLERAADRRNYALRDRGSRIVIVDDMPPASVVQKISRFPERFAGFRVRDIPRRKSLILWTDGLPLARFQTGGVRHSTLTESVGQVEILRELRSLQRSTDRDAVLREAIAGLAQEIYRADEQRGRSGAELLYDDELRGRNGYREREGLKERRRDPDKEYTKAPEHGKDLDLTLSIALQRAAQDVILHPALPPDMGTDRDDAWFASPVGAIVMISVDGDVLAAASAPRIPTEPLPGRSGQRAYAIDRTLRIPTSQPPGSIFKPLIAAHAMETHGLDPQQVLVCEDTDGTGASFGGLHCHRTYGHGELVLHDALKLSCNAYFAQVGELYQGREELLELAHFYGLDEPTGINLGGRPGYYEDHNIAGLHRGEVSRRQRLSAGNGLTPMAATPLQMARAFAGLATGVLPELRMVRSVDGVAVERGMRQLALSPRTLRAIREALVDVCEEGSARRARLKRRDLGFAMAAKTGSADFLPMNAKVRASLQLTNPGNAPSMRKHTWVAGWFPAEDPVAVVVIYLHDIGVTSGKNAIFVAEQFMHRAEVHAFVEAAGR